MGHLLLESLMELQFVVGAPRYLPQMPVAFQRHYRCEEELQQRNPGQTSVTASIRHGCVVGDRRR